MLLWIYEEFTIIFYKEKFPFVSLSSPSPTLPANSERTLCQVPCSSLLGAVVFSLFSRTCSRLIGTKSYQTLLFSIHLPSPCQKLLRMFLRGAREPGRGLGSARAPTPGAPLSQAPRILFPLALWPLQTRWSAGRLWGWAMGTACTSALVDIISGGLQDRSTLSLCHLGEKCGVGIYLCLKCCDLKVWRD